MIGQLVGSHRITAEISHGGMGIVYRAEHVLLGRAAAVKVLLPQYSFARDVVARFFNEAKITSSLRHPNIVEVYDFGHLPDGQAYIVMEFVAGEALSQRLARGPMHDGEVIELGRQIAGALAAAHDGGVIHRDLKPDNVILVADAERPTGWRPKLLDFGIAKLADAGPGGSHTSTGAILGTPSYMSPEQCRGAGAVDARSDLYALGCILYQAVAGQPPFVGDGAGDLIAAHLVATPTPLGQRAHVDPTLAGLVMALLAKRPDERPPTARAVIEVLDAVPQGLGAAPQGRGAAHRAPVAFAPPGGPTPTEQPTTLGGAAGAATVAAPPRRRWPWIVGIGAAASGAAIAATLALTGGSSADAAQPGAAGAPAAQPDRRNPTAPAATEGATPPAAPTVATPPAAPTVDAPPEEPVVVVPPEEPVVVVPPEEPAPPAPTVASSRPKPRSPSASAKPASAKPAPTKPLSTKPAPTKPAPTKPAPTGRTPGPVVDPGDL
ncbi:MAG: protein kinase [Kofleriaceae bacterium]